MEKPLSFKFGTLLDKKGSGQLCDFQILHYASGNAFPFSFVQWAPYHAVVATPLLIAFELLLCIYLENQHDTKHLTVSLQIVFLPLLAFEVAILVDNFRMCKALLPGDDESVSDDAIWETLSHFWVAISMVFFIAATVFTLLKLSGFVDALGWWDLLINFGITEMLALLLNTIKY